MKFFRTVFVIALATPLLIGGASLAKKSETKKGEEQRVSSGGPCEWVCPDGRSGFGWAEDEDHCMFMASVACRTAP